MQQSSIFPIYLKAEYRNDGQGFVRFETEAARAARSAKREFDGVRAAVDQALTRQRNSFGSLDLGVDEMRQAAMAQQQVARASREVAEATKRAALSAGTFDTSMSRATRAAFELANAEDRASRELLEQVTALEAVQRELDQVASKTDLVAQANRRSGAAQTSAANATRTSRTAFIQLGQQLQDSTVQLQMGTNAFTVFGQQAPQAAFALSGLADSANRTTAAVGRFAAFMAGPFGALVFVGVAVLGSVATKLFDVKTASDLAKTGADNLASAQSVLGGIFDETSGKISNQNELLRLNARLTALNLQSEALAKKTSSRAVFASAQSRGLGDRVFGGGGISDSAAARAGVGPRQSTGQKNAAEARKLLEGVFAGRITADEALKRSAKMKFDGTGATVEEFRQAIIDRAFSKDAERVAELINQSLDSGTLAPELRKDRKSRSKRSGSNTTERDAERIATFGEKAAERISRLNERFDESPRLIDQAAQATRELDALMKELAERKPPGFEGLIEGAQTAKETVEAALLRPFEQLREESEQRLQIEALLAAGRDDEATVLQEVLRLERQIGTITAEQREEVEAIVRAEAERTRGLRDQQRLFLAQLDVVDQVQRSLTGFLSGRSTDFFGDFRQALQDLQGQRLFDSIFGQAFEDIENELRGNSPQAKANAAYVAEVERTAAATEFVGNAAISLAEEFDRAFAIVSGATSRALGGVANDNEIYQGSILVERNRVEEVRIARLSINDLAERISRGIGESIGAELDDVFGPRFASLFGDIVGGAIAGKVSAGDVGAVLGGTRGLLDSLLGPQDGFDATLRTGFLADLSGLLGKAGAGAATGTQIAGLSKALGLGGSNTGAQIGGAIGSVIPIPGGDIIGSIAGSILGSLFGGTPRGSATIGGVGSGLGVTGVVGNRGSLRDASGNLAGSVLEAVDRIAEQLGATVNASAGRVSIGQRKDNLRVDPRGGGATKIGNGAIDFGQDAEAAIAFAVRDLINDGVITGLKASEQRLLRAGSDIEVALRDVLTFRGVFDQLDEIRDPVGAAVRKLNREFEGLIELFGRAGASADELADLEELYDIRRAQAVEDATSRIAGALQGLLDDLRIGDNGLSLRTRRANALGEFNDLAGRVAAGDATAFDDFAEIAQQLLDIERQLFGSTQSYFDRLAQITALTEQAIADQTNVTSIAANSPSPFGNQVEVNRSIDVMSDNLGGKLDTLNHNILAFLGATTRVQPIAANSGGSGTPFPSLIANF